MYYWENEELLKPEVIMETFFKRVAGQERIKIGTISYLLPINYETDDKKVVVDEEVPVINLKNNNLKSFKEALTRYATAFFESERNWANPLNACQDLKDKLVYALACVWLNATFDDYDQPAKFFDRYASFLRDKTFEDFQYGENLKNMQTLNNCDIEIRLAEQGEFQETPDAILLTVKKGKVEKRLPRIAYGIAGDTAYIYGIQGYRDDVPDDKEMKKVDRKRYKVNSTERIPEDYKNVYLRQEPYAYISLFAFLCMLKQRGINKVRMPAYLPERYNGKNRGMTQSAKRLIEQFDEGKITIKEKKEMLKDIANAANDYQRIQYNVTNKFLSYMTRMECDVPGIEIVETPDENNSHLGVDISKMNVTANDNIIFYELYRKIEEMMKQKKMGDDEGER